MKIQLFLCNGVPTRLVRFSDEEAEESSEEFGRRNRLPKVSSLVRAVFLYFVEYRFRELTESMGKSGYVFEGAKHSPVATLCNTARKPAGTWLENVFGNYCKNLFSNDDNWAGESPKNRKIGLESIPSLTVEVFDSHYQNGSKDIEAPDEIHRIRTALLVDSRWKDESGGKSAFVGYDPNWVSSSDNPTSRDTSSEAPSKRTTWPFESVDENSRSLFGSPGDLSVSWADFEDGLMFRSPTVNSIEELLADEGWALLEGAQASGKTATIIEIGRRRSLAYYVRLSDIGSGHDLLDSASRLFAEAQLLIVDEIHLRPSLVVELFSEWRAFKGSSRCGLLLAGRRTVGSRFGNSAQYRKLFERGTITATVDPGHVLAIYRRIVKTHTNPPLDTQCRWIEIFGENLVALAAAFTRGRESLLLGDWKLSPGLAAAYVRQEYLLEASLEDEQDLTRIAALALLDLPTTGRLVHPSNLSRLVDDGRLLGSVDSSRDCLFIRLPHNSLGRILLDALKIKEPDEVLVEIARDYPGDLTGFAELFWATGCCQESAYPRLLDELHRGSFDKAIERGLLHLTSGEGIDATIFNWSAPQLPDAVFRICLEAGREEVIRKVVKEWGLSDIIHYLRHSVAHGTNHLSFCLLIAVDPSKDCETATAIISSASISSLRLLFGFLEEHDESETMAALAEFLSDPNVVAGTINRCVTADIREVLELCELAEARGMTGMIDGLNDPSNWRSSDLNAAVITWCERDSHVALGFAIEQPDENQRGKLLAAIWKEARRVLERNAERMLVAWGIRPALARLHRYRSNASNPVFKAVAKQFFHCLETGTPSPPNAGDKLIRTFLTELLVVFESTVKERGMKGRCQRGMKSFFEVAKANGWFEVAGEETVEILSEKLGGLGDLIPGDAKQCIHDRRNNGSDK